jgi:hypothetical protein
MSAPVNSAALGGLAASALAALPATAGHATAAADAAHPDAAIFAAVRAIEEARETIRRTAGAEPAHASYDDALEALDALTPQTPAGVRTALLARAIDADLHGDASLASTLAQLAGCPALADRA